MPLRLLFFFMLTFTVPFASTAFAEHRLGGGVMRAALPVAAQVQRLGDFGREGARTFEHGVDRVGVHIGIARDGLEAAHRVKNFVQQELHVAQRGRVAGHVGVSEAKGGKAGESPACRLR